MLAENLVDPHRPVQQCRAQHQLNSPGKADMNDVGEPLELNAGNQNVLVLSFNNNCFLNQNTLNTCLMKPLLVLLQMLMKILMCTLKKNQ